MKKTRALKLTRRHLLELAGATGAILASGRVPAIAQTPTPTPSSTSLGPLAAFIDKLALRPPQAAIKNRQNFNSDPLAELPQNLTGDDLKAFLSLNRRDIIVQVLKTVTEKGGNLDGEPKGTTQQEFARWTYDFYRWVWEEAEDGLYERGTSCPVISEAYYKPKSQILHVNKTKADDKYDLEVVGEGFIRTKTTVRIVDKATGVKKYERKQDPEQDYTFRQGCIKLAGVALDPATQYQAFVDIDVGNGTFEIGGPGGVFTTPQ
jgi:hypothetical protein